MAPSINTPAQLVAQYNPSAGVSNRTAPPGVADRIGQRCREQRDVAAAHRACWEVAIAEATNGTEPNDDEKNSCMADERHCRFGVAWVGGAPGLRPNNILANNPATNVDIDDAHVCESNGGTTYPGRRRRANSLRGGRSRGAARASMTNSLYLFPRQHLKHWSVVVGPFTNSHNG